MWSGSEKVRRGERVVLKDGQVNGDDSLGEFGKPSGASDAAEPNTPGDASELSELERKILEVESTWWRIAPTRERAIAASLDMTPTRYYLLLSQLLSDERAWRHDPQLIDRLRRLRDGRLDERQDRGA